MMFSTGRIFFIFAQLLKSKQVPPFHENLCYGQVIENMGALLDSFIIPW